MDKPGLRQVPGGGREQVKKEKTGCKIICGAPTTITVKGLIMMMRKICWGGRGGRGGGDLKRGHISSANTTKRRRYT